MALSSSTPSRASFRSNRSRKSISLSTYFPVGTQYFYGYPAGEDSGFLNRVPPAVEELVAERVMSCAGEHVSVVGFAATNPPILDKELLEKFAIPQLDQHRILLLPKEIGPSLKGINRDHVIKDALLSSIKDNNLVMAQPFSGEKMNDIYQIPAKLINYLNDKNNMAQFVTKKFLPARLATFSSGSEFAKNYTKFNPPYVAKASSSSSGDGVYICLNAKDAEAAAQALGDLGGTVLMEQYIVAHKNYAVHFGVPHSPDMPIDFLGVSEQLTTAAGEYIGAAIRTTDFPEELAEVKHYMKDELLVKIREMGWYGVGCVDVLVDAQGTCYFIDGNFRMTATCAYHFLVANKTIRAPLICFSGELTGSRAELEACLLPNAGRASNDKFLQLIALSRHGDCWRFNAALSYTSEEQLRERAAQLLDVGVTSQVLEQITS